MKLYVLLKRLNEVTITLTSLIGCCSMPNILPDPVSMPQVEDKTKLSLDEKFWNAVSARAERDVKQNRIHLVPDAQVCFSR
jgi:hypothetical protein